jgi:hypothetical protein
MMPQMTLRALYINRILRVSCIKPPLRNCRFRHINRIQPRQPFSLYQLFPPHQLFPLHQLFLSAVSSASSFPLR